MKRIKVVCPCSNLVEVREYDDGNAQLDFEEVLGECDICVNNGGRYDRSPHYVEEKPRTTLDDIQNKYAPKNGKEKQCKKKP